MMIDRVENFAVIYKDIYTGLFKFKDSKTNSVNLFFASDIDLSGRKPIFDGEIIKTIV